MTLDECEWNYQISWDVFLDWSLLTTTNYTFSHCVCHVHFLTCRWYTNAMMGSVICCHLDLTRSVAAGFGRHGMPRPPLMAQVQHFDFRFKKRQRWDVQTMWVYDLDIWPWRSPRLSVIHVLVLCQSSKWKFRSMAHMGQTHHVILWPWPLTLEVMALAADAGLRPRSAHQLWSS